jgi:hypothetical protein
MQRAQRVFVRIALSINFRTILYIKQERKTRPHKNTCNRIDSTPRDEQLPRNKN